MFFVQQVAAENYLTAIWTTFTSWKIPFKKIFTPFMVGPFSILFVSSLLRIPYIALLF